MTAPQQEPAPCTLALSALRGPDRCERCGAQAYEHPAWLLEDGPADVPVPVPVPVDPVERVLEAARAFVENGECTDMCDGWTPDPDAACTCGYHALAIAVRELDQ
jgi:hypothetical protein